MNYWETLEYLANNPVKKQVSTDGTISYSINGSINFIVSEIGQLIEKSSKIRGIRVPISLFKMNQRQLIEHKLIVCELCEHFILTLNTSLHYFENCNKCIYEPEFNRAKQKILQTRETILNNGNLKIIISEQANKKGFDIKYFKWNPTSNQFEYSDENYYTYEDFE